MSVQVAVIGSRGYIGRHLCCALQKQGFHVVSLSSGNEQGISLQTGLFPKQQFLPDGIHTVFYLAQSPFYRTIPQQSAHLYAVNCVSAIQAAEEARRVGVKRFIYASTGNVYQPSFLPLAESAPVHRDNTYALSKVMAEEALALYQSYFDITIARIFGVYGPGQTDKLVPMIADLIESEQPVLIDQNPYNQQDDSGLSVSLIYIDDLIQAFMNLIHVNQCPVMNLGGLDAVNVKGLAIELAHRLEFPLKIEQKNTTRAFNLIANIALQVQLLGSPQWSLADGLSQFCEERLKSKV